MPEHYSKTIYMDKQTEIDYITCKAHFTAKEILYKGLDYCLSQCLTSPKKAIKRAKDIIK